MTVIVTVFVSVSPSGSDGDGQLDARLGFEVEILTLPDAKRAANNLETIITCLKTDFVAVRIVRADRETCVAGG